MKKAILVISFGTTFEKSRNATIGAIEEKIRAAYPDFEVRRAFTSQMIINKLRKRDQLAIDNVTQALSRLIADGFNQVLIQPTHIMNGIENDKMLHVAESFRRHFDRMAIGKPLLTDPSDYIQLVQEIADEIPEMKSKDAVVFMGHGSEHFANATYAAFDYVLKDLGYGNAFVGTVEGYPELSDVLRHVKAYGAHRVHLVPLMIVAGDHATNDMAGDDEDSWKQTFTNAGFDVSCILRGLGQYQGVRDHLVRHVADAVAQLEA